MERVNATLRSIGPVDHEAARRACQRLDQLTKPTGSLGRLEEMAQQVAAITGQSRPRLCRKVIYTLAGDHGVAAEGVSAYPQEVTSQMVATFLEGRAAINVLARLAGAEVVVADFGVARDLPPHPGLVSRKIGSATRNFRREPAMTRDEAVRALEAGIDLVGPACVVGTGDMGIANTTAASAVTAVITGRAVAEVTGRGTGIDDAAFRRKVQVIEEALERHRPERSDGVDVLAKVGGFEIAGLAGVILGAAARRIPVLLDGFVSGAAALVAFTLAPAVRPYLLAAHRSAEPGHGAVLDFLGLDPILDLGMRLGEGTGAALAMLVLDGACRVLDEMATFDEAGVSRRT